MALNDCKFVIGEYKDANGNIQKCEISINEIVDIEALKNITITTPSNNEIFNTISNQADVDIANITSIFDDKLKKQLITPHEYATAMMQVLPQIYTQTSQNVLKIKELEAQMQKLKIQVEKEKISVFKELLGLKEQDARTGLYKEQTKGYRDQTRIKTTDLVLKAWLSIYSQNQVDQLPKVFGFKQVDDTIRDLFQMVGMSDPLTYGTIGNTPETTTQAGFTNEQNIGNENQKDDYQD